MHARHLALAAVLISALLAPALPARAQTLKEDRFSYTVPKGWAIKDTGVLKYKVALGPRSNGFSPNIIVIEEPFTGSFAQYVDLSERNVEQSTPGYQKLSKAPFVASNGLKGVKLITNQVQSGKRLRTTFYFFPSKKGRFFVITCSALEESSSAHAGAFDAAMKSFRVL